MCLTVRCATNNPCAANTSSPGELVCHVVSSPTSQRTSGAFFGQVSITYAAGRRGVGGAAARAGCRVRAPGDAPGRDPTADAPPPVRKCRGPHVSSTHHTDTFLRIITGSELLRIIIAPRPRRGCIGSDKGDYIGNITGNTRCHVLSGPCGGAVAGGGRSGSRAVARPLRGRPKRILLLCQNVWAHAR